MSDEYGRRPPRRPPERRRMEFDEGPDDPRESEGDDGYDEPDRRPRRPPPRGAAPRGGGRPAGRRPAPPPREPRESLWSRLFGAKKRTRRPRRDESFDWDYAQDERDAEYDDSRPGRFSGESWDDDFRGERRGPERPRRRQRLTLMEICTPVFAYASILPRDAGGMHPSYQQFRQEVLSALQRIESEAEEHGIDRDDATDAVYALCLFLDSEIAASEWTGKLQWANEPLYAVKLQDPEGGENFFKKLDAMGDRRRAAKEIFLVCLAMGYRGKYADLEPTQQAARLGEIRQKVLRSIHPNPLDQADVLFPEAYEAAAALENDVPPPPRWWLFASIGGAVLALLIWIVLYVAADKIPSGPAEQLKKVETSAEVRS